MTMRFPRELAFGGKRRNRSIEELAWTESDILRAARSHEGPFMSLHAYTVVHGGRPDYFSAVLDTLLLDLDGPRALEDARVAVGWFRARGVEPRVLFSGRRGFHIYADMLPWPRPLGDLPRRFLRLLPPLPSLDPSSGSRGKMVRIPGSVHPATGLYCAPVDPFAVDSFEEVYDIAQHRPKDGLARPHEARNTPALYHLLAAAGTAPEPAGNGPNLNADAFSWGRGLSSLSRLGVLAGRPEGKRHFGAVAVALAARMDGLTEGAAEEVVADYLSRCDPPKPRTLARGYVSNAWKARVPYGLFVWALQRAL